LNFGIFRSFTYRKEGGTLMPLRKRGKWWHYRFTVDGQEYAGSTGLPATEKKRKAAERIEKDAPGGRHGPRD
jgi:hypothetical protein